MTRVLVLHGPNLNLTGRREPEIYGRATLEEIDTMLLDTARERGVELRTALLQAGRTRFRPILMTSLAAILGLFPLALGIGPGAQMQQPLAIMVIGGLTANMLFTRLFIPVGYQVFSEWKPTEDAATPPYRGLATREIAT